MTVTQTIMGVVMETVDRMGKLLLFMTRESDLPHSTVDLIPTGARLHPSNLVRQQIASDRSGRITTGPQTNLLTESISCFTMHVK